MENGQGQRPKKSAFKTLGLSTVDGKAAQEAKKALSNLSSNSDSATLWLCDHGRVT